MAPLGFIPVQTVIELRGVVPYMCKYCAYSYHDGWTQLLQYDDVYQEAMGVDTDADYGFHESYEDLREQV